MQKIEILSKKEDFSKDLILFLFEKSKQLKRDFLIEDIFDESILTDNLIYFRKFKKIKVEEVYGSTFQSTIRSNDNIYAISHYIHYVEIENDKFYAYIEPSNYGEIIDFTQGVLVPVYYRNAQDSEYKIATFDIDFTITNNVA